MLENIKENNLYDNKNLKYLNISNIFFDHKLTNNEILSLKEMLFSINSINQIYFKGTIDLNSIEIIKYLLEISPYINDSHIEKYILLDNISFDEIINMNFENPDSWQIAYDKKDNRYKMTTISKFKNMELYFDTIINTINEKGYSALEKVAFAYNYSKLLDLNNKNDLLPEIVETKEANSLGFNIYFKRILDKLNINSYIGEVLNDGNVNYVTIVDLKDDEYDIDGIYLFDPLSDSIPSDDIKNSEIRNINYNYFCINLEEYSHTVFNDKLTKALSYLTHDYEYDKEKINLLSRKARELLNTSFNSNFEKIHNRVNNSKKMTKDNRFKLMDKITDYKCWEKLGIDGSYLMRENYISRDENIFENIKIKL